MNKLSAAAIQKIVGDLDDIVWAIHRIDADGPHTKYIADRVDEIKTALLGASLTDVEVELPTEAAP